MPMEKVVKWGKIEKRIEELSAAVAEFRKDRQKVHYCFEDAADAYKYVRVR